MKKALISVTGLDTTGIIARVAMKLYELNINILDITQTILDGCEHIQFLCHDMKY